MRSISDLLRNISFLLLCKARHLPLHIHTAAKAEKFESHGTDYNR